MVYDHLESVVKSTVTAFRCGMEAQASEGLVAIIDALPLVLNSAKEPAELRGIFVEMLAAQERKDYNYLADLLEFRLLDSVDLSNQKAPVTRGPDVF